MGVLSLATKVGKVAAKGATTVNRVVVNNGLPNTEKRISRRAARYERRKAKGKFTTNLGAKSAHYKEGIDIAKTKGEASVFSQKYKKAAPKKAPNKHLVKTKKVVKPITKVTNPKSLLKPGNMGVAKAITKAVPVKSVAKVAPVKPLTKVASSTTKKSVVKAPIQSNSKFDDPLKKGFPSNSTGAAGVKPPPPKDLGLVKPTPAKVLSSATKEKFTIPRPTLVTKAKPVAKPTAVVPPTKVVKPPAKAGTPTTPAKVNTPVKKITDVVPSKGTVGKIDDLTPKPKLKGMAKYQALAKKHKWKIAKAVGGGTLSAVGATAMGLLGYQAKVAAANIAKNSNRETLIYDATKSSAKYAINEKEEAQNAAKAQKQREEDLANTATTNKHLEAIANKPTLASMLTTKRQKSNIRYQVGNNQVSRNPLRKVTNSRPQIDKLAPEPSFLDSLRFKSNMV
ncbi:hypothetical protein 3 [Wuhan arthropod virus 3]|uniref:hypothetical protein 3 n=1 Tax=Wuhan arthropod virus 3 TaxID=1923692 RepID=UPI0009098EB1|nr:hypothetical protein 3 [Wuhan arthropod virus 3]APG78406.1 hypothetical protein 3 [Wuhan arthropod virus 3]